MNKNKTALAIHGGAGTIARRSMSAELEREYRAGLETALRCGWEILLEDGGALDAVEAAVAALEDCSLFNAGKGAVFNSDGVNEMDACIMDGAKKSAGAVAFVRNVRNPVKLARLVMERTEHVLLAGTGANEFAREMKILSEPDEYFFTDSRYQQFLKARDEGVVQLDHADTEADLNTETNSENEILKTRTTLRKPLGTVGAVACDSIGNIAAATSTGGMTNKRFGRIGDTPIVGAGTYAENETCAVSCTGHGEFFMRAVAAYDVAAIMKYKHSSLENAAREVVEKLRAVGGEGGLIAVDAHGNLALPFNSEGMYRASIASDNALKIEIY